MNFRIGKKRNQRRFYCEHCKVWIIGAVSDIKNHNGTAMHRKNYERQLEEKHQAARRKRIQEGRMRPNEVDISINLEKTKKEKKKEERKKKYLETLQKEQEKRQKKSDTGLIGEAISLRDFGFKDKKKKKVWEIVIDQKKGKPVFMNTLTGERKDEKPFGLVLDKEDKQLWENCQKNDIDYSQIPTLEGLNTKVGQWQEVKSHENFFRIHAVRDEQERQEEFDEEEMEKRRQKFDEIFQEADGDMAKAVDKILVVQETELNGQSEDFIKAKRLQKLAESEVDLDFGENSENFKNKISEMEGEKKMPVKLKSRRKKKKKKNVSLDFGDD